LTAAVGSVTAPWYREMTRYHWCVLSCCSLAWLFDTMNMRLFILGRGPALGELLGPAGDAEAVGRWTTTVFVLGWATGGLLLGVVADKWGRVKTMATAMLLYSAFSGLTGLASTPSEFMLFAFCNGLGMGGQFAAAVAFLAETVPDRSRPVALGLLQGLSAVGNIVGSLAGYFLLPISWRYVFLVGVLPAILVMPLLYWLEEPSVWRRSRVRAFSEGAKLGSYQELFAGEPVWRRHAVIGSVLAAVGVTGVWGAGFYSPELLANALAGLDGQLIVRHTTMMTICQDVGAFVSIVAFPLLSDRTGRRPAFQVACGLGLLSILVVFGFLSTPDEVIPFGLLLGFGTLALFGGYAVYLPEIFPTRLRSTGVAFCYSAGRYLAALLNLAPNFLREPLSRLLPGLPPYRAGAMALAVVYLVGMVVIPFAPETRGQPLPEDEHQQR
jgi:MFS family permease